MTDLTRISFSVEFRLDSSRIQVRVKLDGGLLSRSILMRLKTFYDAHHILL